MTQNNANNRVVNELLKPLKKRSGAMIGWGIFCIVLGTIGLFAPIAFSVGVTIFIGAMLLVSGATGLALFWKAEGWGARTAAIILALLTALTGLLLMFYPIAGTETLTLFLASYFIAIGLVKCCATWIFGIFVAIELIFDGWTALMFGLEVRALPDDDNDNK